VVIGVLWGIFKWLYGSTISGKDEQLALKDAQIELLERQVSDWKQKTEGTMPGQATSRIDSLEARMGRVEPRRISVEQRDIIGAHVGVPQNSAYSLSILPDMNCTDCNRYALDFQSVLMGANWTIAMTRMEEASAAASPKGVTILTPDPSKPLSEASALVRALKAAEIPFDLKTGSIAGLLITTRSPRPG